MCDSDKDGLLDFSDFARSFSPHSYSTSSTSSAETSGTGAGVLPSQRNDASDARPSSRLQVNRLAVTAIGHERLHRELSEKVHAGLAKSKSMGKNSPSNPNVLKEILEKFGDGSGMLDLTQFANAVKSPFGFRCTTAHADDIKKLFEMYVRTSGCSSSNAIDIRRLCNRLIPQGAEFAGPAAITRLFCNDAKTVGKGPVANLSSSSMMKEQADSFKAVPWALDLRSKEEVKKTLDDEADSFNAVGMQLLRDGKNRAAGCEFVNSELAKESIYIHRGRKMSYVLYARCAWCECHEKCKSLLRPKRRRRQKRAAQVELRSPPKTSPRARVRSETEQVLYGNNKHFFSDNAVEKMTVKMKDYAVTNKDTKLATLALAEEGEEVHA